MKFLILISLMMTQFAIGAVNCTYELVSTDLASRRNLHAIYKLEQQGYVHDYSSPVKLKIKAGPSQTGPYVLLIAEKNGKVVWSTSADKKGYAVPTRWKSLLNKAISDLKPCENALE